MASALRPTVEVAVLIDLRQVVLQVGAKALIPQAALLKRGSFRLELGILLV